MAEELLQNEFLDTDHLKTDLKERCVRGGMWVFALRITDRIFRLARTIVLARILAPEDFGLFGIALLAMSALETFSQTGLNAALIQKKEDTKPYLDMAWTVQAIRGILLMLILFGIAPYVASFFKAPAAKPILEVISVSVLLQGFTNIAVLYFQKELEFRKQFVYMFSGTVVDVGVAISAALLLRNVWALVFGLLAGNLVRMLVSYFIQPYRPRISFDKQQFKELFGFGKWVLGSSILMFLITQGDGIFVGKLLGVTALGFYQLAYRLSNMPATEITHVISQVTFPAYSKLQDNLLRLREAYLKVLHITAFLSFPIAGLIFVLAPDFTRIFLGEKWMPIVPAMQVLVLWGLIRSIGGCVGPLWQAVGKPQLCTYFHIAKLGLLAGLIYPFTLRWGITGAAMAVSLQSLIVHLAGYTVIRRTIHSSMWSVVRQVVFPGFCTVLMILAITVIKVWVPHIGIGSFAFLVAGGAIVYLIASYLMKPMTNFALMATLREFQISIMGSERE